MGALAVPSIKTKGYMEYMNMYSDVPPTYEVRAIIGYIWSENYHK